MPIPIVGAGFLAGIFAIPLVFRILFALGIGIITYVGLDELKDYLYSFLMDNISGLSSQILNSLGFVQIDVYFTTTVSAYTSALLFSTITQKIGVRGKK